MLIEEVRNRRRDVEEGAASRRRAAGSGSSGGGEEGRQWDLGEGPHWAGGRRRGPGRAGRGLGRCLVMAGTSLVSVDFMHRHWEATEPEGQRKGDLA